MAFRRTAFLPFMSYTRLIVWSPEESVGWVNTLKSCRDLREFIRDKITWTMSVSVPKPVTVKVTVLGTDGFISGLLLDLPLGNGLETKWNQIRNKLETED